MLENALSHHIISAVLLQPAKQSLSSLCWHTHSLCLLFLPFPAWLLLPYWLPLFPGWQVDHDLRSQMELKGGLEFLKGIGGCVPESVKSVRERETGESCAIHHHLKSWVYSSKSIWAMQKKQVQEWNPNFLAHCAPTGVDNGNRIFTLNVSSLLGDLTLCHILPWNVKTAKRGGSTQPLVTGSGTACTVKLWQQWYETHLEEKMHHDTAFHPLHNCPMDSRAVDM